ncbi:LuxR family transcriptional regulator [Streptomyces sp. ODS05-4]|uniref:helix-turn-helix transcriptional regulator n=1 Tax=Streptomyces sp. ODS05-4 TaxID=2944939 RepID=UPI00210B3D50|nr:LuxR family transcriptional regulator [Streptomyces sp. ODS05-4]
MSVLGAELWPLVGREAELAVFDSAVADPQALGYAVHGPAGAGRSRLAQECGRRLEAAGLPVRRVVATRASSAVPLGALRHVLPQVSGASSPLAGLTEAARVIDGLDAQRLHLIVDDAHHLDAASAVLLRQLMDAGVLFLIVTIRSEGALDEAVAALLRTDSVYRVDLGDLTQPVVQELLRRVLGGPVGQRSARELMDVSHGNVLYVKELVMGALAEGRLTSDGEVWEIAGGLQVGYRLVEMVRTRLAAAEPGAQAVLELLALCGRVGLADAEAEADAGVLARLEQAGLIKTLLEGRRMAVELSHPVFAQAVGGALDQQRGAATLSRQAARVEGYGMRRREDVLHVASWRVRAGQTVDIDLLVQAAGLAHEAHEYRQVIFLLEGVPETAHTTRSRVLLGSALQETGDFDGAEDALRAAQEQAADEDEVIAALQVRTYSLFMGARVEEALEVTRRAAAVLGSARAQELLMFNEATMLAVAGDPVRSCELFEKLPADVGQAAEVPVWLRGQPMRAAALAVRGRTAEALRVAESAYSVHLKLCGSRDIPHQASELISTVLAYSDAGRFAEAYEAGTRGIQDLMDTDIWFLQLWLLLHLGRNEWLAGHPASARRFYGEAAAQARKVNHVKALRLALSGLAAGAAVLGDVEAASAAVRDARHYPEVGYLAGEERLGEAWLHAATGNTAEGRRVLHEAAEAARKSGHLTTEAMLLTDVARLGAPAEVLDRLQEIAAVCDGDLAPARVAFVRALADGSAEAFTDCGQLLEPLHADLLTAEANLHAARAWETARRPRLATAASIRAQAALARCEGARTPALTMLSGSPLHTLTDRERQIAALAAAGVPSKEIADRLMFSVRTIHNGLQTIYKKIGVTNRRQLAQCLGSYLDVTASAGPGRSTARPPAGRDGRRPSGRDRARIR